VAPAGPVAPIPPASLPPVDPELLKEMASRMKALAQENGGLRQTIIVMDQEIRELHSDVVALRQVNQQLQARADMLTLATCTALAAAVVPHVIPVVLPVAVRAVRLVV